MIHNKSKIIIFTSLFASLTFASAFVVREKQSNRQSVSLVKFLHSISIILILLFRRKWNESETIKFFCLLACLFAFYLWVAEISHMRAKRGDMKLNREKRSFHTKLSLLSRQNDKFCRKAALFAYQLNLLYKERAFREFNFSSKINIHNISKSLTVQLILRKDL